MSASENKAVIRRYLETALAEVRAGNIAATDDYLPEDAAETLRGR